MNPKKMSPASQASILAAQDIQRVIEAVAHATKSPFMGDRKQELAAQQEKVLSEAHPDIQALRGQLPDSFLAKLAGMNTYNVDFNGKAVPADEGYPPGRYDPRINPFRFSDQPDSSGMTDAGISDQEARAALGGPGQGPMMDQRIYTNLSTEPGVTAERQGLQKTPWYNDPENYSPLTPTPVWTNGKGWDYQRRTTFSTPDYGPSIPLLTPGPLIGPRKRIALKKSENA